MRLSPPTSVVWWTAFILTLFGVLMSLDIVTVAGITQYAFWLVVIAALLLLFATRLNNM